MFPYSSTELSRRLGVTPVKMRRRLPKLLDTKVIEQFRIHYVGNLEKKIYRATVLRMFPQDFLHLAEEQITRKCDRSYTRIQQENMKDITAPNEMPESTAIDPIDYGIYADLRAFCRVMLVPQTHAMIQKLEEQLEDCKEYEIPLRPV